MTPDSDSPHYTVPDPSLIPLDDHLARLAPVPASRMFVIKNSLEVFQKSHPGQPVFDASQGDGGASLPGAPPEVLERAQQLQREHGTAYDMPFGTPAYRRAVVEQYWQLDAATGLGPENVLATQGGRDALVKAYSAMLALGHGRAGDPVVVSRVPWISYTWGPYGVGANVLLAPGRPEAGWAYTEAGLQACVEFAARSGRRIAGLILTSPDNPTGLTLPPERQAALAREALRLGAAFVLFDWMYHTVTDEQPMNLNTFLALFDARERRRLIFLDGLTKSLGASNIRNCHLIAAREVVDFMAARASHTVVPSFYSLAVAMAAYELGFERVSRSIIEPTNASRRALQAFLEEHRLTHILGKGYYAFIHTGRWLEKRGWADTEPLGQHLAEQHGVAVVPGAYFSPHGAEWIRFSYATPVERTQGAARRLVEGLAALERS